MSDEPAVVILLNGPGSAGKSSIARALQAAARRTFLHVSMDGFLEMMPERLFGLPEGLVFRATHSDGKPAVAVEAGPAVVDTLFGMRRAIAALADTGLNIIVDDVLLNGEITDYESLLTPYRFLKIGVTAPLEALERREKARGDREIGLSRLQIDRVHVGIDYDMMLDTSTMTVESCALHIRDAYNL